MSRNRSFLIFTRTFLMAFVTLIVISLLLNKTEVKEYAFPISCIIVVIFSTLLLDRCRLTTLGLNIRSGHQLFNGFLLGALANLIYFIYFSAFESSGISLNFNPLKYTSTQITYLILIGFSEELLFRGYLINRLPSKMSNHIKNICISLIFTSLHLLNPDYRSIWVFLSAFILSMALGYIVLITECLWLTAGFHIIWNIIQLQIGQYNTAYKESIIIFLISGLLIILVFKLVKRAPITGDGI